VLVSSGLSASDGADDLAKRFETVSRLTKEAKHVEAVPIAEQTVDLARRLYGEEHAQFASALSVLSNLYVALGRYSEAERLFRRSLDIRERVLGPNHPDVGRSLEDLVRLYRELHRTGEAAQLARRSLEIQLGRLDTLVKSMKSGDEVVHKRKLALFEETFGPEHPSVRNAHDELAAYYWAQGRIEEAGRHFLRSIAILEKALGPEHAEIGKALSEVAGLYWVQRRYDEAEPLYVRSLTILDNSLGPDHELARAALDNLTVIYSVQRRTARLEPHLRRRLATREKQLGSEHPDIARSLIGIAAILGRTDEAKKLTQRALAIREKTLSAEHPALAEVLNSLAYDAYRDGKLSEAVSYWRRSTDIIKRRAMRGLASSMQESFGADAERAKLSFWGLVLASSRLEAQNPSAILAAEMFETAQWALGSEAAASLAQMAARSANNSPKLAALVRERQDIVVEWQEKDKLLLAAKSKTPDTRDFDAEKTLNDRLVAIELRREQIDGVILGEFPDYNALATPAAISIAQVQAQLNEREALVLFFDTNTLRPLPEETSIWVVTKRAHRWVRSEFGTTKLRTEVAALRCGLDESAWYVREGLNYCRFSIDPTSINTAPKVLPFSHDRAHKLYSALFGKVQDLIKGKELLIVASGPLAQLPFHVLVARAPTSDDHRTVHWLARDHAVTVLPAASSLKALRRVGKPSAAPRPMLGIGNPLLDGPDATYANRAKLAKEKQLCPGSHSQNIAASIGRRGGLTGVRTNVADIRSQVPLPETADELCAVAQTLKARSDEIRLGARATEREIKRLHSNGELAKYRMLHFATHGVLSGQLDGAKEPGLILTPPDTASDEDDGYLSASEIASLRLDADWVILSACNTAGGASANAQTLSGLARAFIYAQARALLVSHWEVDSNATVKVVTTAIGELARSAKVGRAEALRRSMLALIEKGEPHEAHPAFWAPFVVVGEGAAAQ
jgi:CHAT domain-containing protein/tetratricopeptide (TPR) repeat protein